MKQLLLAACAVLALSGSGHARSANIPSFLVDGWCREDQVKLPQAECVKPRRSWGHWSHRSIRRRPHYYCRPTCPTNL
jgi:hypothetical protein